MLEQKIEALTNAVNKLIEVMEQDNGIVITTHSGHFVEETPIIQTLSGMKPDKVIVDEIEEPASTTDAIDAEPVAETTIEPITDDKLRLACTAAVKASPDNRTTIKDKLSDYGVTKVGDLPTDGDTRAEFLKFVTDLGA